MKLYSKEVTAQSIAAKLSKGGKQFEVQAHDGQWAVVEVGTAPVEDTLGDTVIDQPFMLSPEENAASVDAIETALGDTLENLKAAAQAADEGTVTVHFPGARLTPNYVITQPMGKSKKGPVERWIERSRVKSATATLDGVTVTLSRKALKARGIDADKYVVAVTPTEFVPVENENGELVAQTEIAA